MSIKAKIFLLLGVQLGFDPFDDFQRIFAVAHNDRTTHGFAFTIQLSHAYTFFLSNVYSYAKTYTHAAKGLYRLNIT